MSDKTELPPLIEPWRIVVIILTVISAMIYAHSITPTQAGAMNEQLIAIRAP